MAVDTNDRGYKQSWINQIESEVYHELKSTVKKTSASSDSFTLHRTPSCTDKPGPFAETNAATLVHLMPHLRCRYRGYNMHAMHVRMRTGHQAGTRL